MADFDKILKENIEAVFLPMVEKMLGISIKKIIEIKDKIQRTIEREMDFLKIIIDQNGSEGFRGKKNGFCIWSFRPQTTRK